MAMAAKRALHIGLIPGDGIGREVIPVSFTLHLFSENSSMGEIALPTQAKE
jgi:isocitrate/isopropylmalate dehydrogenase